MLIDVQKASDGENILLQHSMLWRAKCLPAWQKVLHVNLNIMKRNIKFELFPCSIQTVIPNRGKVSSRMKRAEKNTSVILLEGTSTYIQHIQLNTGFLCSLLQFFSFLFPLLWDELRQCLYSPTTMRLCSKSGRVVHYRHPVSLGNNGTWLQGDGCLRKTLGKSAALTPSVPTPPAHTVPLLPAPWTVCFSCSDGLCLPKPCSPMAPAKCSPCTHPSLTG